MEAKCSVTDCGSPAQRLGICSSHYAVAYHHRIHPHSLNGVYATGCMLCGGRDRLKIDHDHSCCPSGKSRKCGKCVRGALCNACNVLVGHIEKNLPRYERAVDYALNRPLLALEEFPPPAAPGGRATPWMGLPREAGTRARLEQLEARRRYSPDEYAELLALRAQFATT